MQLDDDLREIAAFEAACCSEVSAEETETDREVSEDDQRKLEMVWDRKSGETSLEAVLSSPTRRNQEVGR